MFPDPIPPPPEGSRCTSCLQSEQPAVETGPAHTRRPARVLGWIDIPGEQVGCSYCYSACREDGCEGVCMHGRRTCREHTECYQCTRCEEVRPIQRSRPALTIQDVGTFCRACQAHVCRLCGNDGALRSTDEGTLLCETHYNEAQRGKIEEWDEVEVTPAELLIPALPARPVRVMSVEQEWCLGTASRSYNDIPAELCKEGLCWGSSRLEYHAGRHDMPCHVERDSSIDGGELIHNRMLLSRPEDAEAFVKINDVIRNWARDGRITFDIRTGVHIHVDLHGFDLTDVRNLVLVYNWMEDPMFRLASAGYPDHRAATHGRPHAAPIMKGKWKNNRDFGVQFLRNADHYDGLNLMWFYRSLREGCRCGAVEFGNLEDCSCNRGKATAEWRIFNGTTNPRVLHAYMAFVQSLTAWVQGRNVNPDEYEPLEFNSGLRFDGERGGSHINMMGEWKPRIEWWFTHLTMTDLERESLLYTIKRSALKCLGEEYLDGLLSLERVVDDRILTAPTDVARPVTATDRGPQYPEYCEWCDVHIDDCRCEWCDACDTVAQNCRCDEYERSEVEPDYPFEDNYLNWEPTSGATTNLYTTPNPRADISPDSMTIQEITRMLYPDEGGN